VPVRTLSDQGVTSSTPQDRVGRCADQPSEGSNVIGFIVFGLVVGALARLIVPGKQALSIWMTLLLGLAGSVIGGVVASVLGTGDIFELNFLGSIVAILAAAGLILVGEKMSSKQSS
jgi:uncharacterized membrane protein YeaQ/YmgE (transglycosylase-associated protein family)